MIKLVPNPTFEAPVKLAVPGQKEPVEVTFTFRALARKHLIALLIVTKVAQASWLKRNWEYLKLSWRVGHPAGVIDMLNEVITGWKGFDVDYSKNALHTLVSEFPGAHSSIFLSYLENQEEGRRKN